MGKNKQRLIQSNYKSFSDDQLLKELNEAVVASNTLKGTDMYYKALDGNGVSILSEELTNRGIATALTLFG